MKISVNEGKFSALEFLNKDFSSPNLYRKSNNDSEDKVKVEAEPPTTLQSLAFYGSDSE